MHTIGKTLLEGMFVVSLVLFLFLGSPRAAAIVALTIPLSLLIAFIFMHHFDIPANLLSLGAIDFGIIVDGSIFVMENILRRREERVGTTLPGPDVIESALEMTRPVFFGMLVIITGFMPLLAFQRIERKLLIPAPLSSEPELAKVGSRYRGSHAQRLIRRAARLRGHPLDPVPLHGPRIRDPGRAERHRPRGARAR